MTEKLTKRTDCVTIGFGYLEMVKYWGVYSCISRSYKWDCYTKLRESLEKVYFLTCKKIPDGSSNEADRKDDHAAVAEKLLDGSADRTNVEMLLQSFLNG